MGYFYLDTGVLYRAITLAAISHGVALDDGEAIAHLARTVCLEVHPPTRDDGRQVDVLMDGQDVSLEIRQPAVDRGVSAASAHQSVRAALGAPQRGAIRAPGTILAGRDIGTVIVPEAPLKVWLTASVEERARRRSAQTGEDLAAVLGAMRQRDHVDGTRAVAPMKPAVDAVEIVTDGLAPEQIVEEIVALARSRGAPG